MSASASLWRDAAPLVLASRSAARIAMLEAAGLPVEPCPADIDERGLERDARAAGADASGVAVALARAKALDVAARRPGRLVLGADQTLAMDAVVLHKPESRADAARQLAALSGRAHALHAAAAVVRDGTVLFETVETARMTMRTLTPAMISLYLEAAGDAVLGSVGAYQLERLGVHLFERIEGDHFTILGLPLLKLLAFLRGAGSLAA
ncbi:Maf family protein [Alsobacter sp. SYSU M60028]|uniref:Nucleoside triphosphate pyrophosphatase n=1 Tax=Alsobacter ponti TaxID=2962936 RepID=A0ABT1LC51_9HYPH|nr:Maf family protein [Alsobacter ponti]MCP8938651.1 Maf family protein [Alsobacter ponti]